MSFNHIAQDAKTLTTPQPLRGPMYRYLLEMNDRERKALARTLKKAAASTADASTIESMRTELSEMLPHLGIVIDVPEGVNIDDLTVMTSLQMPLDVYITQRNGNSIEHVQKEPTRNPDRVHAIISSIGVISAARPLLEALDAFRTTLVDACETTAPNLFELNESFDDFANLFNQAREKIHALDPQR